jgi:uncharacterized protein (DUF885 family)
MVLSVSDASKQLATLADEYWQLRMRNEPLFATALGDRRYDDQLPQITPQAFTEKEHQYESILRRTHEIPENDLSANDRLTLIALVIDAQALLDDLGCHLEEWTIDPLDGPQVEFLNLESYQPVRTPAEGHAMVERWKRMGVYLNDHMANLRRGLEANKVAVGACVEKVIDEIRDLNGKQDEQWALLRPLAAPHDEWTKAEQSQFRTGLRNAVRESVRPAFLRYLAFLESDVLPRSRPQERPGIVHIPGGMECYHRLIRVHTSLNLSPNDIYETGLREVARINHEMEVLGEKLFGTGDRKRIQHRLRTDPSLYFGTRDEVAAKAEDALARAKTAIPKWFGRLPKADCEVVRMEEHEEKHSTVAYYREPAADGSRPGRYYINTSAPETRPRYEAEVLAYHESIPGHHLQLAIAQELENIPAFRKYSGVTAFIEGWGLYTERLADEMGLYSSELDRIGVLSYDAWRACRLVVDSGMHARKWTRQQAIDFMLENTALAENNIVNEVDRYITWPGQAVAYKIGQLEIHRLREHAKQQLGNQFDIREFHDVLLGNGALALEALQQVVNGYISQKSGVE